MRIDKYDPKDGGFRAPLAADTAKNSSGNGIGVGLDSNGRVVAGAGNTGILGVLVLTSDRKAAEIVDVMTDGEMVEASGLTAGTTYYAAVADGVISTAATGVRVGHTVEATRLVVRMGRAGAGEDSEDDLATQASLTPLIDNTDGAAPDDTIADIPAVVAAAGEVTAADLATTQAALAAVEDAVGELAAKVNEILTTLDAANVTA